MPEKKQDSEQVVDQVWSGALAKISKNQAGAPLRSGLGDEIDLVVPQAATAAIMNANPAFSHMLYSSAYSSAKRNAYLMIRQLGMPPDFFWKFDYWTQERAFETMQKVLSRIFATLMVRQKAGTLALDSLDVERTRFTVSFADCAECFGLKTEQHICYFQAGLFAGILGALLNRELDSVEVECIANGGKSCVFRVGTREDKEIMRLLDERSSKVYMEVNVSKRVDDSLEQRAVRDMGNLVDVGYYQLLLSSAFLGNMSVLSVACLNTGRELGLQLAPLLSERFQGTPEEMIGQFYRKLRYVDASIVSKGDTVEVRLVEAPEMWGPMQQATLVPFICGELQSLLTVLMKKKVAYQSSEREGSTLVLLFAPQVGEV